LWSIPLSVAESGRTSKPRTSIEPHLPQEMRPDMIYQLTQRQRRKTMDEPTTTVDEDAADVLELLKAIDEDDGTRYTMDEVMAIVSDTRRD
jgi:GDP-D-mannose dehydratase